MSFFNLVLSVLVIGATFFVFGQRAAAGHQATGTIKLHSRSLPRDVGVITSTLPALLILLVIGPWQGSAFSTLGQSFLPTGGSRGDAVDRAIAFAKITNVVDGIKFGEVEPWVQSAGEA